MKKITLLIVAISMLALGCNPQTTTINYNTNTPTDTNQPATPSSSTYENSSMKVTIPDGWTAKQAGTNQGAVNITKGNFILYINTKATQASGVEGGRFAEIAQGSASADAVVTSQPSPPCGTSETNTATADTSRVDLYVSASETQDYCKTPTNGKNVWYFSYITSKQKGGYFNYLNADQTKAYVVTMSYNSKDINNFPAKGDADLNSVLGEMTTIVQSLQIK